MTMSISSAPAATASLGVGELDRQRGAPGREGRGDGGDVDAGAAEGVLRDADQVVVDADRGDGGDRGVGRVGALGLGAQGLDLARGVGALERREVDHPDRQVDGPRLGVGLDRPGGERGGALVGADLVDAGQPVQELAQARRPTTVTSSSRASRVGAVVTGSAYAAARPGRMASMTRDDQRPLTDGRPAAAGRLALPSPGPYGGLGRPHRSRSPCAGPRPDDRARGRRVRSATCRGTGRATAPTPGRSRSTSASTLRAGGPRPGHRHGRRSGSSPSTSSRPPPCTGSRPSTDVDEPRRAARSGEGRVHPRGCAARSPAPGRRRPPRPGRLRDPPDRPG